MFPKYVLLSICAFIRVHFGRLGKSSQHLPFKCIHIFFQKLVMISKRKVGSYLFSQAYCFLVRQPLFYFLSSFFFLLALFFFPSFFLFPIQYFPVIQLGFSVDSDSIRIFKLGFIFLFVSFEGVDVKFKDLFLNNINAVF